MQARFHLDAPGWFGETDEPQHLRAIADALLADRLIDIRYQSWRAEKRRRVAPLGLVLKGGNWYLAGRVAKDVRTYRVARILDCTVHGESFARPADFDLGAYWRAATERLEAEMHPREATVRLSPLGVKLLDALTQPYVKARLRIADDADAAGWRTATIPIGTTHLARRRRAAAAWPRGRGAGAASIAHKDGGADAGDGPTLLREHTFQLTLALQNDFRTRLSLSRRRVRR